jgi:hypothetical protein
MEVKNFTKQANPQAFIDEQFVLSDFWLKSSLHILLEAKWTMRPTDGLIYPVRDKKMLKYGIYRPPHRRLVSPRALTSSESSARFKRSEPRVLATLADNSRQNYGWGGG